MLKKYKLLILLIALCLILSFTAYQTYAYLTQTITNEYSYTIDKVNATVTVTGDATTSTTIKNADLAYVHYMDDVVKNKYGMLGKMASEIHVSISFNNNFPTRVKVKLPTEVEGLLYIVIDETTSTKDLDVDFKVENGTLQYGFVENGTVSTWNTITTGLSESLSCEEVRTLINNYNKSKLESLYKDNLFTANSNETFNFRILIWGDYYDLPDKSNYLDKTFNLQITAKVLQAIDQYGGELDYEND